MHVPEALSMLAPLGLDVNESVAALEEYGTLACQATVLKHLLPGREEEAALLKRDAQGGLAMQVALLKELDKMLPLDDAVLDMFEEERAEVLDQIPFVTWFPHWDENLDPSGLPEGEALAAILSYGGTAENIADLFDLDSLAPVDLPKFEALISALEMLPEPACFMADAFRVVNRMTGLSIWDGVCTCGGACGCGLPWDVDVIKEITAQREEAEAIGKRLATLTTWITQDPKNRVPFLVEALRAK